MPTVAAVGTLACSRSARLAADLVIVRANVWTGNSAQPAASAIAVLGDRIVDVGSDAEIDRWRGPATTVVDAGGRRVVPGFNDTHVHLGDGGAELDNVDLKDAATPNEFVRRIAERVKAKPGEWILGGRWDEQHWTPRELPTRQLIDDVTNGTPVFVSRYDGHLALANSAALGRAGITERTLDPPGGAIVRDPKTGFPTGVLSDAAMDVVMRVIPKMTLEQRLHLVQRALEHAASLGVTSVQDMNPVPEDLAVYSELANRGELTTRIYAMPLEAGWYDQAKLGIHRAFGSSWLRLGAVACAVGTPQNVADMRVRLTAADCAGLQLCVDASGHAAISDVLDIFGDIARANGGRDRRFRIEHARDLVPQDVERVAALHVIASVQPYQAIGAAPIKTTNAYRTLLDKGVRLAFGTDWPADSTAAPLNPMLTLHAATTAAGQRVTIIEAVTAYTSGSAFAEFQEREKGTLARGMLADFAVLSDDIFAIPPDHIKDVRVLTTIVGGKVVHQGKP
jgi:predicted amidohydrolase YtcJ